MTRKDPSKRKLDAEELINPKGFKTWEVFLLILEASYMDSGNVRCATAVENGNLAVP